MFQNVPFHFPYCRHTAANFAKFLASNNIKMQDHPPYSQDRVPGNCFMFSRVKTALASKSMGPETFQKEWDRVTRTLASEDYAMTFLKEVERYDKCIQVAATTSKKVIKRVFLYFH